MTQEVGSGGSLGGRGVYFLGYIGRRLSHGEVRRIDDIRCEAADVPVGEGITCGLR